MSDKEPDELALPVEAAARALLFRETMSDDGLSLDEMAHIAVTAAAPFITEAADLKVERTIASEVRAWENIDGFYDIIPDGYKLGDGKVVAILRALEHLVRLRANESAQ